MTALKTKTDLNELVNTHNIFLALKRLQGAPYDNGRAKRALYHALLMANTLSRDDLEAVRRALGLP